MNKRIAEKIEAAKTRKLYKAIDNSIFRDLAADGINRTGTITREDPGAKTRLGRKVFDGAEANERSIVLGRIKSLGFRSIQEYVAYTVRNKKKVAPKIFTGEESPC